ncbi:MAG: phage holin [Mycetocola reblochoni]|uniref:phage holin n=1 Tax=Mycetocola reblochoni TaxID=331618 RepID=UPI003F9863DA
MTDLIARLTAEATRAWLYRILAAVGVLLVGYGIITTEQAGLWAGLALAAFGLPAANTPTKQGRHATE